MQVVDKDLPDFYPEKGPPVPMKDSWRLNVAAYKLDRLLDMRMVPATVKRSYNKKPAAFTWWVDDLLIDEAERVKKEIKAPDPERFSREIAVSRTFDELIINIDRNLSNLLITKNWNVVLIDHSRSFTGYRGIRNQANLTRCSTALFGKMKALTIGNVSSAVGSLLTKPEIAAVIARRDLIVAFFERKTKTAGADDVLFS